MDKASLESWLNSNDCINVQMPNEIFEDLDKAVFKSFNHKCFAYAYYYLISHLYRNTLYGGNTESYSQQNIIKLFAGNKTLVSYITKNGGLLDQIGYTKTTTDYPVGCYMDNGILEFGLIKELRKRMPNLELNHSPRFSIKEPIKGMKRFNNEDYTGTFYSFQNTHSIDIKRFIDIISDEKLGHVGFFIYGYISMMCDKYSNAYQITYVELGKIVGCSDRTIKTYILRLEEMGFLESTRRIFDNKLLQKIYSVKR
ncbi:hypothetical protein M5X02_30200 [Paenibacillus alvei]|uniref:hypothetical protein n=1 Tax=Paenibacillus alvei TaxID=44250 RepID=UPI0021D0BE3D|nr:hypothetical protein [Paenibacillus alvei]MCY9544902.1 hypothetical protein [Paenibacillus alvei]MEC0082684.1 hypothetical protein [Paenibacillus alvei]